MGLSDALLELEQQAAIVASFLDPDDEELLQQIADAWAPLPVIKGASQSQRRRWQRDWIAWLLEAAERWEARPAEPSADDLHRLLIRWATGTPPARRHETGHSGTGRWPQKADQSSDGLSV